MSEVRIPCIIRLPGGPPFDARQYPHLIRIPVTIRVCRDQAPLGAATDSFVAENRWSDDRTAQEPNRPDASAFTDRIDNGIYHSPANGTPAVLLVQGEGEPSPEERLDPEGGPLSGNEQLRLDEYNNAYRQLQAIDPKNPALGPFWQTQNWIPSDAEVDKIQAALAAIQNSPRILGSDVKNIGVRIRGRFPTTPQAPNIVMYRADSNGNVTSYQVWGADGLPIYKVDVAGASHGGVPTPHVTMFDRNVAPTGQVFVAKPSSTRRATPAEIP